MRLAKAGQRSLPSDPGYVLENYVQRETRVSCMIAVEGEAVLGLQALSRAWAGNPYDLAEGIGVIGTHIDPTQARRGIGRALFAHSLAAAREAGLVEIDAQIGADNDGALAYYEAMGFRSYIERDGRVGKRLVL